MQNNVCAIEIVLKIILFICICILIIDYFCKLEYFSYEKQLPKNILDRRYSVEKFIKHATYDGRKKDYYFGTGSRGTGYYLDEGTR